MSKPKILVIDDNQDVIKALHILLQLEDMQCVGAESPEAGLKILRKQPIDLVIQDMNFSADMTSGEEGAELYRNIRKEWLDLPVILLTAWACLESAVALVKAGAADYLAKPWDDDKLLVTIKNLLELSQLQTEQGHSRRSRQNRLKQLNNKYDLCGAVVASDTSLQLMEMATKVAPADVAILITGPNGAGKEKVAEVVQANSSRKKGPFVKVNAGALPDELMEAELFGAEAGAYTGNTKQRIGRFEAANGGTLFLDEIGNLSLEGQKKLLRVLETGEFERLGSAKTIKTDVRVISATNSDLSGAIRNGTFREDLYYRLNLIELNLAPLKQRKEDILQLAQLFMGEQFTLSEDAENMLQAWPWPGNVRELQNVIKRAMLLSPDDTICAEVLGLNSKMLEKSDTVDELTRQDIEQVLEQNNGIVTRAAKSLGLSRQALYRRMEKFAISVK